jgi:CBS domain-containing protein
MKVQDVMNRNVKSCGLLTTLADAAVMMWEYDCGALPVLNDSRQTIGMITDRDIAIAVATKGRLASEVTVSEVCFRDLHNCFPDDDLKTALKTMRVAQVRRLPVVNADGLLQGILSISDIVLCAEKKKGLRKPELSFTDTIATFKAICEHRQFGKAEAA